MTGPGAPDFYGAVTVGERGQIVIPQAAREKMGIKPGDKILVVGKSERHPGLLLLKAEAMNEFLTRAMSELAGLEKMLRSEPDKGERGEG